MTTFTHSCGSPLYLNDKFCIECGETAPGGMKVLQIPELKPDLFDDLLPHFPQPKIFTGKITDTYHYQRVANDSNLEFSYWWVTLQGEEGQQKQVSLSSEDSFCDSIKVGDVLTIFEPSGSRLTRKLKYKSDRARITNDASPGVTLFHKNDGQTSLIDPWFKPDEFSLVPSVFYGLILAVILWLSMGAQIESAIIGVVAGIILSFICYKVTKKSHLKSVSAYAALENVVGILRTISKDALGYNEQARPKSNDDLLCNHCQNRNPPSYKFCYQCGHAAEASSAQGDYATNPCESVRSLRLKILNEFNMLERRDVILRRLFLRDWPAQSEVNGQLFRVVDREVATRVRRWTEESIVDTHYRSSSGGYSRTERTVSISHYRTSGLSGSLWVENAAGEILELDLPSVLLKSADIGNYIFCGWGSLKKSDAPLHQSMEFGVNLNKELAYYGDKLANCNVNEKIVGMAVKLPIPLAIASGWFAQSWEVGLATLVALFGILWLMCYLKDRSNQKTLIESVSPIYDLKSRLLEQRQSLLDKLVKLS